jgi:hypothetical protein
MIEVNPFRPELMGRTRIVFVAPDSEYQLAFNDRINAHFVTSSVTEDGFLTARKQISAYHYAESELGKPVKAMRPVKEFDDIVDAFRGYAVNWNRKAPPLTLPEKVEAALPIGLKAETIAAISDGVAKDGALARRLIERNRIEQELSAPVRWRRPGILR